MHLLRALFNLVTHGYRDSYVASFFLLRKHTIAPFFSCFIFVTKLSKRCWNGMRGNELQSKREKTHMHMEFKVELKNDESMDADSLFKSLGNWFSGEEGSREDVECTVGEGLKTFGAGNKVCKLASSCLYVKREL